MITTISINQNAANPNVALQTFYAFKGSYSNLRIKDIPPKIGSWNITDLSVQVSYPDNTSHIDHCVEVSGVYVSTLPPSDETGRSANGYQVLASGIDEDGSPVNGYVLGSGDVVILDVDATVTADDQTYYLHMRETRPEDPVKGDSYIDNNGMWHIYTPIGWADFMTSQVVINTYSREECDEKFRDKNDLTYGVVGARYEIMWNGTKYICERYGEGQYSSPTSREPGFKWIELSFDDSGANVSLMQADEEGFPANIASFVEEGSKEGDSFQISNYHHSIDAKYKVETDQIALKSYVDSKIVVINTYSREECDEKFRDKNDLNIYNGEIIQKAYDVTYDNVNYRCLIEDDGWYRSDNINVRFVEFIIDPSHSIGVTLVVKDYDSEGQQFVADSAYVENVSEGQDFEGISRTLLAVSAKYNPVRDVLVSKSYVDSKGGANWGSITGDIADQADLQEKFNAIVQNYTPLTTFNNTLGNLSAIIQGI